MRRGVDGREGGGAGSHEQRRILLHATLCVAVCPLKRQNAPVRNTHLGRYRCSRPSLASCLASTLVLWMLPCHIARARLMRANLPLQGAQR